MDHYYFYPVTGHYYRACIGCRCWRRVDSFYYRTRLSDSPQTRHPVCKGCGWRHKQDCREEYQREAARAMQHHQRALWYGGGGIYSVEEWVDLCKQYDHHCLWCRGQLPLTVDHVVPLSQGGSNTIDNIQPLCQSCNSAKGDREMDFRPQWQKHSVQNKSLVGGVA